MPHEISYFNGCPDSLDSYAVCLTGDFNYDSRIPFASVEGRWIEAEALEFISRLQQFAEESDFKTFLIAHSELFEMIESEGRDVVLNHLPVDNITDILQVHYAGPLIAHKTNVGCGPGYAGW